MCKLKQESLPKHKDEILCEQQANNIESLGILP